MAGQSDDVMGRVLTMRGKPSSWALCCHLVVQAESRLVGQNELHLKLISCFNHEKDKSNPGESLRSPEIFMHSSLGGLKSRRDTIAAAASPAMSHISASVAFFSASSSSGSSITCSCSGISAGFLATKVFPGSEQSQNFKTK